jgi:Domain of unknown function (DUF4123)
VGSRFVRNERNIGRRSPPRTSNGVFMVTQLEQCLWPKGFARDVWMIVDSARDRRIFGLLLDCFYSNLSSLFATPLPPQLESVAPYLFPLDYDDKKTRKFLSNAWGRNWGVFIRCDTSQDRLRRHLRSFVSVRDPRGRRLLFRFYDPRVLRTYLPTCSSQELGYVFGPIECFWTESKIAEHLLEFRFDRGMLVQRTVSLVAGVRGVDPTARPEEPGRTFSDLPFGSLSIRQAQFDLFSRVEAQKFEDWMVTHLQNFFPQQSQTLGESQIRELIWHGIKRAAEYGITAERDVCKFIDLMIVFGREFDRDKKSAWAGQILANRKTARSKIRSLYEAAELRLGR